MVKTIPDILDECQRTFATHKRGLHSLRKIQAANPDQFTEEFVPYLNQILLVFKREPSVERLIQLIVQFATANGEGAVQTESEFAIFLISYLLEYTGAKDKAVRFRSTQLVSNLINSLNQEAEIEDELWNDLLAKMLQRTKDKVPVIRCYAVNALARLQNPTDPEDPVLQEYLRMLANDSSADVRKAVLNNVGLSKHTLREVLQRTKDVKDDVRRHAYGILTRKVPFKILTIAQRVTLVKEGLADRVDRVREACLDMICEGWLNNSDTEIMKFLSGLDVEEFEDVAQLALNHIFKRITISLVFNIEEELIPESALFWRCYISYLRENKKDSLVDELLPEISKFCKLIVKYQDEEFITKQLLRTVKMFDFSDEVGRRNISAFLRSVISKNFVGDEILAAMFEVLRAIHTTESELVCLSMEMISDIQDPLEDQEDNVDSEEPENLYASLTEEINVLQKQMNILARAKKFGEAQKIKEQIESTEAQLNELHDSRNFKSNLKKQSLIRCLMISRELLEQTIYDLDDPSVVNLLTSIILPSIQNANPLVRDYGVQCLGLYCTLSSEVSYQNITLFLQILENDQDEIKTSAMRAIFDILLLHAYSFMEREVTGSQPSVNTVINRLREYLHHDDIELRTNAAEGFTKLMFNDIYLDSGVVSDLLILFFDPTFEEDLVLRQCLSVFFPAFAFSSRKHQELVQDAYLATIRRFLYAMPSSPLHQVSPVTVAQFMIYLTSITNYDQKDFVKTEEQVVQYHEKMCLVTLNEILSNPTGNEGKILSKVLPLFSFTKQNQQCLKPLRFLVERAVEEVTEKTAQKLIKKFAQTLEELDMTPKDQLGSEVATLIEEQLRIHRQEKQHVEEQIVAKKVSRKQPGKRLLRKTTEEEELELEEEQEVSFQESSDEEQSDDELDSLKPAPAKRSKEIPKKGVTDKTKTKPKMPSTSLKVIDTSFLSESSAPSTPANTSDVIQKRTSLESAEVEASMAVENELRNEKQNIKSKKTTTKPARGRAPARRGRGRPAQRKTRQDSEDEASLESDSESSSFSESDDSSGKSESEEPVKPQRGKRVTSSKTTEKRATRRTARSKKSSKSEEEDTSSQESESRLTVEDEPKEIIAVITASSQEPTKSNDQSKFGEVQPNVVPKATKPAPTKKGDPVASQGGETPKVSTKSSVAVASKTVKPPTKTISPKEAKPTAAGTKTATTSKAVKPRASNTTKVNERAAAASTKSAKTSSAKAPSNTSIKVKPVETKGTKVVATKTKENVPPPINVKKKEEMEKDLKELNDLLSSSGEDEEQESRYDSDDSKQPKSQPTKMTLSAKKRKEKEQLLEEIDELLD